MARSSRFQGRSKRSPFVAATFYETSVESLPLSWHPMGPKRHSDERMLSLMLDTFFRRATDENRQLEPRASAGLRRTSWCAAVVSASTLLLALLL